MLRIIGMICIVAATARAQGPRTGGPAPGDFKNTEIAVDAALTGNLARGVSDRDLISFRGLVNFWSGRFGVFVQPYYLYGDVKLPASSRVQTDDERYLRALAFYTFYDPVYAYAVTALDHSLRRKIGSRGLIGGGAGVTVVNRPGLTFLSSVGLLYERAHYDGNTLPDMTMVEPVDRRLFRTSLRIYGRYKLIDGHLNILHDIYLIPALRDFSDLRAMFSGVVEVPVVAGFAGRVAVDATYEGYIVPGTQHEDIAITFGISYKNDWVLAAPEPQPPPATP